MLTYKRHDSWPPLHAKLEQENLSGALEPIKLNSGGPGGTAALKVTLIAESTNVSPVVEIEGVCTITNAAQGEVEYQWLQGDLGTVAKYQVEFEIEWPLKGGEKILQSVPDGGYAAFEIIKDLGKAG